MISDNPDVIYAIDADDQLVELSSSWEAFAQKNDGGVGLHPRSVLGQSLWSYVRGRSLQTLYHDMIAAVRRTGRTCEFRFRCDSPVLRRYMHMRVDSMPDRHVQFRSCNFRVERRDVPLYVQAVSTGDHHLQRCSICNLFELPDGAWSDAADAVTRGQAMNQDRPLRIIWSVCEPCRETLRGEISQVGATSR
ncbi:hypothetical protein Mal4_17940 [Maioricimonas rarisocia]|uniref:PAS fold protein n=1 Tax=Maioricimonas rarisocia TaxID=2528026 RepID=A0A517Z4R4_9PLAN|nr:hypothetical protein [Maioricimonas rarisocia]QDU37480.1 hypothetical protein Mal4_17940 [Maioricimonas rarisocia]